MVSTENAKPVESREPLRLAEHFLLHHYSNDTGIPSLRRYAGKWWRYDGSGYVEITTETLSGEIWKHLDALKVMQGTNITKVIPRKGLVADVIEALKACGTLLDGPKPQWLDGRNWPEPQETMAFSNCLLHVPTRTVLPKTPAFFASGTLPYAYDKDALAPRKWLDFIDSLFGGDTESLQMLQEWFGYCLVPDTRQQKMLLIVGPKRAGKGTIGRVLKRILGDANVCAPTLGSLTGNFGLAPLLAKSLAIFSDARLSNRTDQAVVVERLLSISGADPLTVDIKFRDQVTVTLPTRIMILANELPKLADISGALASRFLVIKLKRSFYDQEIIGLTEQLLSEKTGILNWALEGYDSLQSRGRFIQPGSSTEVIQELENLGSPVLTFMRERCDVGSGGGVECAQLYAAYREWHLASGRTNVDSPEQFGRDFRTAEPTVQRKQRRIEERRVWFYEGIRLQERA